MTHEIRTIKQHTKADAVSLSSGSRLSLSARWSVSSYAYFYDFTYAFYAYFTGENG